VTETGIEVTSRIKGADPKEGGWKLGLSLARSGREGALEAVEPAPAVAAADNRIELRRGAVTEWYVNTPRGLEQGFRIDSPPEPYAPELPVILEMNLTGGLSAAIS
jgi:hypothetical protein